MAMSNQSLQIIGKALGHRSATSYARLANDPVRNAMQTAQQEMLTAAGLVPLAPTVVPMRRKKGKK